MNLLKKQKIKIKKAEEVGASEVGKAHERSKNR
jgi:hypothetical protein